MTARLLTYDGTTYRLKEDAVGDLVARGVVKPDEDSPGQFRLGLEHAIEEIEPFATVLERVATDDGRSAGQDAAKRRLMAFRFAHRNERVGR